MPVSLCELRQELPIRGEETTGHDDSDLRRRHGRQNKANATTRHSGMRGACSLDPIVFR
jgi:hypothetical protein